LSLRAQGSSSNSSQQAASNTGASPSHSSASTPRGQKLVLKDGTFQLVREYKVEGDRVTYYSLDTHQWEEMPASLIDWDATRKQAGQEAGKDAALLNAVDEREKAENAAPLNVDASIEPAPGVFLPEDNGLYVFDGKAIQTVKQAEMTSTLDKGKFLEKVLVPVPLVPTRHLISIIGTRAQLRLRTGQPEFYFRAAQTMSDGSGAEIDLVKAKVKGNERQVENVDQLLGETSEQRKSVALLKWELAPDLYRYTFLKPLEPGEYVLVESMPGDQIGLYLWDFGIDVAK
jgi:hypothetical protein